MIRINMKTAWLFFAVVGLGALTPGAGFADGLSNPKSQAAPSGNRAQTNHEVPSHAVNAAHARGRSRAVIGGSVVSRVRNSAATINGTGMKRRP